MSRKYCNINNNNENIVLNALSVLTKEDVSVHDYRDAFYTLGAELGKVIKSTDSNLGHVMLVCASEDADWLANGLINSLDISHIDVAVFWSERERLLDNPSIEISPIIKEFIDKTADCDTMIIAKSIISSACVVKTQLNKMITKMQPRKIKIVAPVMYKDAASNLEREFPKSINQMFEYISFAIDSELDENHMVLPGIGGAVYPKLGLENVHEKNFYMPNLVRTRMMKVLQ